MYILNEYTLISFYLPIVIKTQKTDVFSDQFRYFINSYINTDFCFDFQISAYLST